MRVTLSFPWGVPGARLAVLTAAVSLASPASIAVAQATDAGKGVTTFFGTPAEAPDARTAPAAAPAAAPATVATQPVALQISPLMDTIRAKASDKAVIGKAQADHAAAVKAFYTARAEPIWTKDGAFTPKATVAFAEIKKADAWGLDASALQVPDLASGASADAQAEAEIKAALVVLKYADAARGGRIDPLSLSNILDMKPPVKDPDAVLTEIADASQTDAYLRDLHPKHDGFLKLKAALEKARGPQVDEPIDEALKVRLPDGKDSKSLKLGDEHDDVVLLRKRLKVEAAAGANEKIYDAVLQTAVKTFQDASGIKATGQLNGKTRTALNKEGEPKKADPKRDIDRIIANMERWRWLPVELGPFYVMNNVPEFTSRTMKGGQELLKQKMIVGQPSWPTPVLTSSMQYVIFHPEWGVPDGIKVKELLPRLKRASAQQGGGFFDQLFTGGSSGGARVLAAYKLNPSINGKPVNADSVDWNKVDIRQFSFVQPAGVENPLGLVKFRFPNRHDVYMHDTPQKSLFGQTFRALSHGCMRLDQPRKLAEVILAEDKGWSADKVGGLYAGTSNEITLSKPVPVYLTYFTARVNDDGKLQTFNDLYGHDARVTAALQGKPVKYYAPSPSDEVASGEDAAPASVSTKKQEKKSANAKPKKGTETAGDILSDALSGLLGN